MKCKRCNKRVPSSCQGEFGANKCHCRKCWAIINSKWKEVKNKESDLKGD